jgi:hypothetical protein
VACGEGAESIRAHVAARRASSHQAMIDRFARAKAEGDLPGHIDEAGLAAYLLALLQGMAVQAGAGVPADQLERMIETSLAVWPSA